MELSGNSLAQRMARLAIARSDQSVGATTRATAASAFDQAIEHFAHGHWSEAFEELVPLADAGHREAARIAMLMTTRVRGCSAGASRLRPRNASVGTW